MSKENTVVFKSEKFAVRIIRLYQHLCDRYNAYDLFRQILRSGTSIGANIAEAECGVSEKDFLHKMYISLKESAETLFWLKALHNTGYLSEKEFSSLYKDCYELKLMLTSITKTLSEKLDEK